MKENKNNQSVYEEPLLEVIRFAETDVIATSGENERPDYESELIRNLNYQFGGTNQ